jgi:ATP synthase protein I
MVRAASGAADRPRSCWKRCVSRLHPNGSDACYVEDMTQARGDDDRDEPPADEAALSARLQRLGERLGQQYPDRPSENDTGRGAGSDTSALARGLRLSAEFVAGILVGAALGWLLDWWLGTSPWGMIVFLLFGFAAGVLNMMRAAGVVPPNSLDPPGTKK